MPPETKKKSRKTRKRYHHGDLRQALIEGALEIISESNVEALSLRALARKVGVSYAAPYHHFEDKTTLLAELATQGFKRLDEEMRRHVAESAGDPKSVLLSQGRAYLLFAVNHPSHYRVMFNMSLSGDDDYPDVKCAADSCFANLIVETQAVIGSHVPVEEVSKIANVIWCTVHGAATLWNDGPMKDHLDNVSVDTFVELITAPLVDMLHALTASVSD